ncbi:hypothetical protein F4677DRAFT_404664 [Hypoxylon crocopeplum]|nr:hypothetical protein F4677DRAFT_404664 [Hypoxylon crocopeplum]
MKGATTNRQSSDVAAVAAFSFDQFPPEVRDVIWKFAAEQATDEFRRRHDGYHRYWHMNHRAPYVYFNVDNLEPEVVRTTRSLFWPLLQASKESRQVARAYVFMVQERRMAPKLVINFADRFIMDTSLLQRLVTSSKLSDKDLRMRAGLTTTSLRFPLPLEEPYQRQLDDLCTATNILVSAAIFTSLPSCQACQLLLLRFQHLRVIYIDVTGWNMSDSVSPVTIPKFFSTRKCQVELSETLEGEFRLKWEDEQAFNEGFEASFDKVTRAWPRGACRAATREGMKLGLAYAWKDRERWRQNYMDDFLRYRERFAKKGIDCIITYKVCT